jgi:hypothetical protein
VATSCAHSDTVGASQNVPGRPRWFALDALVAVPAFRFSGERPRPHESTAVRLIRPNDLLPHPGVQDRPQVSTTVVSTALAVALPIPRPLTFRC